MIIAEQVLGELNADGKDLLRLFKCLESVQRATDAEPSILLSRLGEWHIPNFGSGI